jgi:hypothetical protein
MERKEMEKRMKEFKQRISEIQEGAAGMEQEKAEEGKTKSWLRWNRSGSVKSMNVLQLKAFAIRGSNNVIHPSSCPSTQRGCSAVRA